MTDLKQEPDRLPHFSLVADWPIQAARAGDWQQSAERWAVLRSAYPKHPQPVVRQAAALIETSNHLERAAELLAVARERFPGHAQTWVQSARLATREGRHAEAESMLASARQRFPDEVSVWRASAELASAHGDAQQAERCSAEVRRLEPDRLASWTLHAELAMAAADWDEALRRWASVREFFPGSAVAYERAIEAAERAGKADVARELALSQEFGLDILDELDVPHAPPRASTARARPLRHLGELIWTKAVFGLRSEVQRNYLGYAWWILEPVLHMGAFYLVFGLMLRQGDADFPLFLICGLVPWMWFSKSINAGSTSILGGQQLLIHAALPPIFFPLVTMLQFALKQIPVFVLLLGAVVLAGHRPQTLWLALLPLIALQALLTVVLGCVVAAVVVFARDFSHVVSLATMFLMFVSGIFYDIDQLGPQWHWLATVNPMALLLEGYRSVLLMGVAPDTVALSVWALIGAAAMFVVAGQYRRLRHVFPRVVLD